MLEPAAEDTADEQPRDQGLGQKTHVDQAEARKSKYAKFDDSPSFGNMLSQGKSLLAKKGEIKGQKQKVQFGTFPNRTLDQEAESADKPSEKPLAKKKNWQQLDPTKQNPFMWQANLRCSSLP